MFYFENVGILETVFGNIEIKQSSKTGTILFDNIPNSLLEPLMEKSIKIGKMNNESFMDGTRNHIGLMGEYLFSQITRDFSTYCGDNVWDYDFLSKGFRVDVKTKRQGVLCDPREGKPEPFDVSVPMYSNRMDCDRYSFFRVHKSMNKAWMVGRMNKKEYFTHPNGVILEVGDKDGMNEMEVKKRSFNLKYCFTEEIPKISKDRIDWLNIDSNKILGSKLSKEVLFIQ